MMRTVWKYEMAGSYRDFEMPVGAEIIHVDQQVKFVNAKESFLVPCMWAIVDPDAPREVREFFLAGTGIELPEHELKYLGTVKDGAFVWHVFEVLG